LTFGRPWWIDDAGLGVVADPLAGDLAADVAIVGGGFTGLWTALALRARSPELDVALVEADFCGSGPSGRNGGFVHGYWSALATALSLFGRERALELARAGDRIIPGVRDFLQARGEDAWLHVGGLLEVSAAPVQDAAVEHGAEVARSLGVANEAVPLDASEVAERCASPVLRGGVLYRDGATVHPGRLVRALREAVLDARIRLYERSPVTRIEGGGRSAPASAALTSGAPASTAPGSPARIHTATGSIRADAVVVATNAWMTGWRPVANRVTNMGSWVVLTEPAPDALETIGWTGHEAITDGRTFLHYFRTTDDGRVLMGAGAGQIGFAGRVDDRFFADQATHRRAEAGLRRLLPGLADVKVERTWGGPIDVSADRLPFFGSRGRVHFGVGYTGNGVGPSWLGGQILASLALGIEDEWTSLPLVGRSPRPLPPEPFRYVGGRAIRSATLACEDAGEAGRPEPPIAAAIASIPRRLGIPLGTR
jgi:glycine/D-amino acid oxidase-like deaminating enzyme